MDTISIFTQAWSAIPASLQNECVSQLKCTAPVEVNGVCVCFVFLIKYRFVVNQEL